MDFLAHLLALEQLDQLPDFFTARLVVAALVLNASLPTLVKIDHRAFIKRAVVIAEYPR